MRLEQKRDSLLIIPECEADRAFIEDTLRCKTDSDTLTTTRIHDVSMGFAKHDTYVLKIGVAAKRENGEGAK